MEQTLNSQSLYSQPVQLMHNKSFELSHNRDVSPINIVLHSHDFYELYFFVGGKAVYSVENLHYNLVPGDIMLVNANVLHQLDVENKNIVYERIVLWINPKYMKKISTKESDLANCFVKANQNKSFLVRDFNLSEKVRSSLLKIENLENQKSFGTDIEKEILIKNLLIDVNRFFASEKFDARATNARYAKHASEIVTNTMKYIEKNLQNELTLDEISRNVYMSKFYLSRIFREETKTTIHQYITKKRLIYSKSLIEKNIPIKELYEQCGFKDQSSFFRSFKAEFGITPKQYEKYLINS